MLKRLLLNFGPNPESLPLECPAGVVTVFVGPNNSGKSQALADIVSLMRSTFMPGPIIGELEIEPPEDPELRESFIHQVVMELETLRDSPVGGSDDEILVRHIANTKDRWARMNHKRRLNLFAFAYHPENEALLSGGVGKKAGVVEAVRQIHKILQDRKTQAKLRELALDWVAKGFIGFVGYAHLLLDRSIKLNGATRLQLVQDTEAPDWRGQSEEEKRNHLVELLKHPERLESLRKLVHKELRKYPVIDTTHRGVTSLKLTDTPPGALERSTTAEALAYFDQAQPIDQYSDGVKSFVGLLAAILSGDHRVVLVDEPEAFLHPPLARGLGTALYQLARSQKGQVVAATHSPDFLMGCVQAGPEVSIIRLSYKAGVPSARTLSPQRLREVMRHPLLRSTGVLGALFHEGAIVCESDSDRAFYQEVNERLMSEGRGARGCAFLNAQNKQTLHRIIGPLREMGVPAAAIVDLDVVSKGDELRRLLDAAQAQPSARDLLLQAKDRFVRLFCEGRPEDEAKKLMKRDGMGVLKEGDRKALKTHLLDPLAEHGIFVLPCGELESWLPALAGERGRSDKAKWLTNIFEQMGDDPDKPGYVRPGDDDVWDFMDRVAAWIANPESGMPRQE